MTQGVSVRAATIADLPDLMHLETLFPEGDRISARSWRRFIARPGCVLAAVGDKAEAEILGAAVVLTRKRSQTARIYSLAVDPRAQRRGVGQGLVEAALAYAQSAGCARLSLEVRPDNAEARTLYRKCGFEDRSVKPQHYADGTAALIMDRSVADASAETQRR